MGEHLNGWFCGLLETSQIITCFLLFTFEHCLTKRTMRHTKEEELRLKFLDKSKN